MRPTSAIQRFWRNWNQPSDLGLRMTKLGLLLLIATLIGNRILPKIEVESSDTLAVGLLVGFDIIHWLLWIVGWGSQWSGWHVYHRRALMWKTPYIAPRTSV